MNTDWLTVPVRPRRRLRSWYVRGIAACHVLALASLRIEADALVGDQGLLPVSRWLPAIAERAGYTPWLELPTLLWLWPSQTAVRLLCDLGLGLGLALVLGFPWSGPVLLALGAIYLSLANVCGDFLRFQWDSLLIESTFASLFVARWTEDMEPPRWAWGIQRWLLFRLMFWSGVVKLSSGDPHWIDWTALDYHFWTQPLPNPLSRWAHHWPGWIHAAGTGLTLAVELGLPWLIPLGRRPAALAALGFASLMGMLALTGNYGFFQILSFVLCLPLLDDGWLGEARALAPDPERYRAWRPHLGAPLAALWVVASLLWLIGYRSLPPAGQGVLRAIEPFHLVNPYGLFAVMTTDRIEIQLEGSWDGGQSWSELPLKYKPGDPGRTPPQVAPHMPRIDWQLWFVALSSCEQNPWLIRLMERVAEGSPPILDLFVPGTFDRGPPREVRVMAFRYWFAPLGADTVWDREELGLYCDGVVSR